MTSGATLKRESRNDEAVSYTHLGESSLLICDHNDGFFADIAGLTQKSAAFMFCKATAHDGCSAASHSLRQTDNIARMTAIDKCQNGNLMSFILFRRLIGGRRWR